MNLANFPPDGFHGQVRWTSQGRSEGAADGSRHRAIGRYTQPPSTT